MNEDRQAWWNNLRHGGLLFDHQRLESLIPNDPPPLNSYEQDLFRRKLTRFKDEPSANRGEFISHVMETICSFSSASGTWSRGSSVQSEWSRMAVTGQPVRPRHLWQGVNHATLPVFIDDQPRLGIGRSQRAISQALGWLRQGKEQLALITNGQQWRLLFAGLDYEAFCEWDIDLWLSEGELSPELNGFRSLIKPRLWTPPDPGEPAPLLVAINESRKGQSDLSQVLGERVRMAVEMLVRGHSPALNQIQSTVTPEEIYRAGVRVVMRMVVILFAESREGLLPRDNPIFHSAYSLQGLREQLERISPHRLKNNYSAWPRVLSMFRLIHEGSSHEALPVPAYGGELFAAGNPTHADGMARAISQFESACFEHDIMSDAEVKDILVLLTRTKVRIRQGRSSIWTTVPVDFSSLDSEYIGILYEGLLDFKLRTAPPDQPVVFLALGNQPALPLATLEAMSDTAIKNLLEKMKDTSTGDDEDEDEDEDEEAEAEEIEVESSAADGEESESVEDEDEPSADFSVEAVDGESNDTRQTTRSRAETWAKRACAVGGLVSRPRGRMTLEKRLQFEAACDRKAREIIPRIVLPGEWYLVRWGGTRKGSGTFYTRPQLAVPTVHRTLRPLAYDPPVDKDGKQDVDAPLELWSPKLPEVILNLKVCDLACGSGTFPLAAMRFLTEALYRSLHHHNRIREHGGRAILSLITNVDTKQYLAEEALPCRPEDDHFEPLTRAILRRYVVERCIYGVDLDPLAVELCRLSLWIGTMDRRLPFTFLDHKIKPGNALVGAWFDQFLSYPAMAWAREGGDKNHTNGVHLPKEARTRAIKEFNQKVKDDLKDFIDGGRLTFAVDLTTVLTGHDSAETALRGIHELGIAQVAERAERFAALQTKPEFQRMKAAFDLWCALWFWPADALSEAPLPSKFATGELSEATRKIIERVSRERRFFHWELEFPDVFNNSSHGFDGILGNPPWETLQPNSKEFFSAVDPLYRSYGKQDALGKQKNYFKDDAKIEREWIDYIGYFKCFSNWLGYAGHPFGDLVTEDTKGKKSHDINLGDRGRDSFRSSQRRHSKWKLKRETSTGYADTEHSFRHQGSGKAYTYKMFVEQCHALLVDGGRLGLIVPSGIYTDYGAVGIRRLFIDKCNWEWLFAFENRDGIFDIHRYVKFAAVIAHKNAQTQSIRTAFMRRQLTDWEHGEGFAIAYTREQVVQFSPHSRTILEILSQQDLEVLTKIYAKSVFLDDRSESGWDVDFAQGDFNMTSDSKLFPPRKKWEDWGYKQDEYCRWLKAPWKPIQQLIDAMGVTPLREGNRICAQPPYDKLPMPRSTIAPGVILSRDVTEWICEDEIEQVTFTDASDRPITINSENEDGEDEKCVVKGPAVAIPLYQGVMIWQLDSTSADYLKGATHSARWQRRSHYLGTLPEPQFVIARPVGLLSNSTSVTIRIGLRAIQNSTNKRTMICTILPPCPGGHSLGIIRTSLKTSVLLPVFLCDFAYDFTLRHRMSQANLSWFVLAETPVPNATDGNTVGTVLCSHSRALAMCNTIFAPAWIGMQFELSDIAWRNNWAATEHERMRRHCIADAISLVVRELDMDDVHVILKDCDYPLATISKKSFARNLRAKGFWRVDNDKTPEHRHTILSLVAFHDLQQTIAGKGGDVAKGIEAFCNQNEGEGWMLPETLRLADYGLGHDDRAKEHQPVRECFGPRFYDWQLAQTPEESWKECNLHARNLLGEVQYAALLDELTGQPAKSELDIAVEKSEDKLRKNPTPNLFE